VTKRVIVGAVALLALVVIWFASLSVVHSQDFIFVPDRAHPVDPLVSVQGGHRPRSQHIYFVDIFVRRASVLEVFCLGGARKSWLLWHVPRRPVCGTARRVWPGIDEGSQLVPRSELLAPGVNDRQRVAADTREMTRSQQIAAAVALRAAGYHVHAEPTGALIDAVASNAPAAGKLLPTDVVVTADREPVRTPLDLRRIVGRLAAGASVRLGVRRGSQLRQVVVRTIADRLHPHHSIIGVFVDQAVSVQLPVSVKINAGSVGGPSAGLAFALDILEQLGKDVVHGRRVAATGEIELDGTVGPVGGIEQKTIGVSNSGIHFFLVPAGENASEARRFAHGVRIVPVHSFRQALRSLATLTKSAA
jgi:Lon-like protease